MARCIHVDKMNKFVVVLEFDVNPSAKCSISLNAGSLCDWYLVVPVEVLISINKFRVNVRVDNDDGYTSLDVIVRVVGLEDHMGYACKCFCNLIEFGLGFLYK